jgi:serine/threonine protein kinase
MAKSNTPHAILFDSDEGPDSGTILIRPISQGSQGKTYIVRNLSDGQPYIRKKMDTRTEEATFMHLIPASMAPPLVSHYHSNTPFPTLIYAFCNGGDLSSLIQKYTANENVIPEAVFWHFVKQMIEILAYIHSGWTYPSSIQENWQPIVHADIHSQNVLLHWPSSSKEPFPNFMLGDWGLSFQIQHHNTTRPGRWRRRAAKELHQFLLTLFDLNIYRSQSISQENCPIWLYDQLRNEDVAFEDQNPGMSVAQYIAEKFIPRANIKIAELQAEEYQDLRWTKPDPVEGFAVFGGGGETPAQGLKKSKWKIEGSRGWRWIDVEELPDAVNGSSTQYQTQ